MNGSSETVISARLRQAFESPDPSARLQAALNAGTRPDPDCIGVLIERCATETDFFVRDMLSWALARQPVAMTMPLLLAQARSTVSQARSQALHTLSKIGDSGGWHAITPELLRDADDDVARSAWRAAVVLVPTGAEAQLASLLCSQLGRGDREVQLSLSRALIALGNGAALPLSQAAAHSEAAVRTHAAATERLALYPDEDFDTAVFEANRGLTNNDADTQGPLI